jgi:two-component system sensor histidine kinase/response regulator
LAAVRQATEAAADLFDVQRASVWQLRDEHCHLECIDAFDARVGQHSSGVVVFRKHAPSYFAAAFDDRVIAAHDARTDPRTREFSTTYLEPLGIVAMLDAPIYVHGDPAGMICLEHAGENSIGFDHLRLTDRH